MWDAQCVTTKSSVIGWKKLKKFSQPLKSVLNKIHFLGLLLEKR
jgi:hypothetical protein